MKLSIIVCTYNRAHAIIPCLDSIAASLAHAAPIEAEIVVVDNASTDNTSAVVREWAKTAAFPVQLLFEAKKGLSAARNCGIRGSRGDLLAWTDDDCRLSKEYVLDLLRHDATDTELVIRGGRVELGDPTDLPMTIKTALTVKKWSRQMRSARREKLPACIIGCNMTMRRDLIGKIGLFDEHFGAGTTLLSGEETDYIYRTYLADMAIEYVPDMVVYHHHGRKTIEAVNKLIQSYTIGQGSLYAKYLFRHLDFIRPGYWTLKGAVKEILAGHKHNENEIGIPAARAIFYYMQGALRYWKTSIIGTGR